MTGKPDRATVLIIEDDPDYAYILDEFLTMSGFNVLVTQYGEAGIEHARLGKPDIIFLDILISGIDGYETCRRLKADPATGDIPVIFMSAMTEITDKIKGLELGAADYITKPFNLNEVLARINAHLTIRRQHQEMAALNRRLAEANEKLTREIQERTRVQEALRLSEERYRRLTDSAPDIIYSFRLGKRRGFEYINPAVEKISGYSPEDFYRAPDLLFDAIHPEDRWILDDIARSPQSVLKPKIIRWISKSGKVIWIEHRMVYHREPSDGKRIVEGIARDITERTKAQKALEKSETQYRLLIENMNDVVASLSPDGTVTYVSSSVTRKTGFEQREIVGRFFGDLVPPEDRERLSRRLGIHRRNKKNMMVEFRFTPKTGEMMWSRASVRSLIRDGRFEGWIAVCTDITERKRMELALAESKRFLENIFNAIQDGICVLDREMNIVSVNRTMEKWYARSMPLVGKKCFTAFHCKKDGPCDFCPTVKVMEEKTMWMEIVPKNSALRSEGWQELFVFPLLDVSGELAGVVEYLRDVTDRKKAEDALKAAHEDLERKVAERTAELTALNQKLTESEETVRVLLNAPLEGVSLVDLEGVIIEANEGTARILDVRKDDLIGRPYFDFLPEEEKRKRKDVFREVIETGLPVRSDARHHDRFFDVAVYPVRDAGGRITSLATYAHDITEIRQLQAELVRSERLAATGQLAASVAHEINSPLAALGFAIHSLRKKFASDSEILGQIEMVNDAIGNIRSTVNNLLDLNRPGKMKRQPADINDIIRKTAELNRGYMKKQNVRTALALSPDIPLISVSPQEISQVFINLIKNAMEAIPSANKENGLISIASRRKGETVEIRFQDNGPGIPESDIGNIFDPFFTRKKTLGMGVGLSICMSIVRNHGGTMTVANQEGGGALFVICLPLKGAENREYESKF